MPLILNKETGADRLLVWRATEPEEVLRVMTRLNPADEERLAGLHTPERIGQWLAARVIVWRLFGKHIGYTEAGQPFLEDSDIHISITHTADLAAVMTSPQVCGADMENIGRRAEKLVRRYATDREIEMAKAAFAVNPAILIWSAKEALYKLVQKPGAEFRSELTLDGIDGERIRATACSRRAIVEYSVHDNILITQAKYSQ